MSEEKIYHRLTPRPVYDIGRVEAWLEGLAEEGLFLTSDGFFCGFGSFVKREPAKVRYRFIYSGKAWDERPEDGLTEIMNESGWEFVASRGKFDIFMSRDENAVEPNTDPELEAITFKKLKNDTYGRIIYVIAMSILYPFFRHGFTPVMSIVMLGTPTWILLAVLMLTFYVNMIAEAVFYAKAYRNLKKGKEGYRRYYKKKKFDYTKYMHFVDATLVIVFFLILLISWKRDSESEVSYEDYKGDIPFATFDELVGGKFTDDLFMKVKSKSDILAPQIVEINSNGYVIMPDGQIVNFGLYVNYIEAKNNKIAMMIAKEYENYDKRRGLGHYEKLPSPDICADYISVYSNVFPTIIMVKDNIMVRAYYYAHSGDSDYLSIEDFSRAMYDSLG